MRFFIVLALFSLLVALANAYQFAPDFVTVVNKAYKKVSGSEFRTYRNGQAGVCVNVDKAFKDSKTMIHTQGRSVELYAGANCKNKFATSPARSNRPVFSQHSILSFKVNKK